MEQPEQMERPEQMKRPRQPPKKRVSLEGAIKHLEAGESTAKGVLAAHQTLQAGCSAADVYSDITIDDTTKTFSCVACGISEKKLLGAYSGLERHVIRIEHINASYEIDVSEDQLETFRGASLAAQKVTAATAKQADSRKKLRSVEPEELHTSGMQEPPIASSMGGGSASSMGGGSASSMGGGSASSSSSSSSSMPPPPSAVRTTCPSCGTFLSLPFRFAGNISCMGCYTMLSVQQPPP